MYSNFVGGPIRFMTGCHPNLIRLLTYSSIHANLFSSCLQLLIASCSDSVGFFLWAAWSSHFLLQLHCNRPHMSRLPICDENGLVLEFTEDKGRLKMPSIGSWQARRVGWNLSDPAAAPRQTDWKSELNSAEWTLKISNALCFRCLWRRFAGSNWWFITS